MTENDCGILLVGRKRPCMKESRVTAQGRREVEVGTLCLLGNGKNNVIADKKFFLVIFSK